MSLHPGGGGVGVRLTKGIMSGDECYASKRVIAWHPRQGRSRWLFCGRPAVSEKAMTSKRVRLVEDTRLTLQYGAHGVSATSIEHTIS